MFQLHPPIAVLGTPLEVFHSLIFVNLSIKKTENSEDESDSDCESENHPKLIMSYQQYFVIINT